MDELALFAGAGGGLLGSHLLGHTPVCAVELDSYARRVLLARQRDGHLPRFPIWDDIRTFDGKPWRGVDIVSGGFPCQDISAAGKGAGIEGAKSGLWVEMARIIREVGPRFAFMENSPNLTSRGLGVVLRDLASMGFNARWGVYGARHVGAPHKRDRIWILASNPDRAGLRIEPGGSRGARGGSAREPVNDGEAGHLAYADRKRRLRVRESEPCGVEGSHGHIANRRGERRAMEPYARSAAWETEPGVGRVADGVAHRVDRLRALGNGQVPAVAALAWRVLGGPVA